jgi:predicted phosphodiesterase
MINKTKLAKEFIEEHTVNGICKFSKKKLGELLSHKHKDLFPTPENGRKFVRIATGANGEEHRKQIKNVTEWNGFKLPKPEKNDASRFNVSQKRIGILSDIHFPYYDKVALELAVNYLIKWKPDCIILNGDIIDCYHLSSFVRDRRQRSFKYELDMLKAFFVELRELFPKARIIYKLGNHEERYEKTILCQVPELIDLEYFTFENVIKARDYSIEVVKNKRLIKAGHLNIAHGHEWRASFAAPVNPARGFYLKAKANILAGHCHRTSEHFEQDVNNKIIGSWSVGCLSELNPHYAPYANYNHGFATVEIDGKDFKVDNKKIYNGKIL